MTTPPDNNNSGLWPPANDGDRPQVTLWIDHTDTGTSVLIETDHQGQQHLGALWQPNDLETDQ